MPAAGHRRNYRTAPRVPRRPRRQRRCDEGRRWRSPHPASTKTTIGARATATPALRARAGPPRPGSRTTDAPRDSAISAVSSSDPSSTTITSMAGGAARRTASRQRERVADALWAGNDDGKPGARHDRPRQRRARSTQRARAVGKRLRNPDSASYIGRPSAKVALTSLRVVEPRHEIAVQVRMEGQQFGDAVPVVHLQVHRRDAIAHRREPQVPLPVGVVLREWTSVEIEAGALEQCPLQQEAVAFEVHRVARLPQDLRNADAHGGIHVDRVVTEEHAAIAFGDRLEHGQAGRDGVVRLDGVDQILQPGIASGLDVIAVERQVLRRRRGGHEALVAGGAEVAVLGIVDEGGVDLRMALEERTDVVLGSVRRSVVDNDQLVGIRGACDQGLERARKEWLRVPVGDDDRHAVDGGRTCGGGQQAWRAVVEDRLQRHRWSDRRVHALDAADRGRRRQDEVTRTTVNRHGQPDPNAGEETRQPCATMRFGPHVHDRSGDRPSEGQPGGDRGDLPMPEPRQLGERGADAVQVLTEHLRRLRPGAKPGVNHCRRRRLVGVEAGEQGAHHEICLFGRVEGRASAQRLVEAMERGPRRLANRHRGADALDAMLVVDGAGQQWRRPRVVRQEAEGRIVRRRFDGAEHDRDPVVGAEGSTMSASHPGVTTQSSSVKASHSVEAAAAPMLRPADNPRAAHRR